jgi:hypothetical protein
MAETKDIKYINRDFNDFRSSLINFSQTYFPSTYNDFSQNSPGSLFIEMASYVGDVLSFYLDNQVQETFLQYARQEPNLYELAYMMGYTPKVSTPSLVDIEIYQQIPAKDDGGTDVPDFDYALLISENSSISSTLGSNISFLVEDPIDFTVSSSLDPTEISVYTTTGGGADVDTFLLKKTRKAKSATINTITQTFTDVERYPTITINDSNIIGILDITDSDGNIWYEVPYLAQETVYNPIKNKTPYGYDPNTIGDIGEVPYVLSLKKVPRRFVTRFKSKTQLDIQFGAGTNPDDINEQITPNPENVGIGLPYTQNKLKTAFDPQNFLYTNTYGIAPSNTTLTIRYLTGGGVTSNVEANILNTLTGTVQFQQDDLTNATAQEIFDSLLVTNPSAATGGSDGDSVEEIRNNSLGNFGAQLRAVTPQDYLTRALSLPSQFGTISKAYIEKQKANSISLGETSSLLDLYVLSYNSQKQLTTASTTLKKNLSTYISQYRSANDSINIKDAFIVNIGIDFDLIILPNYNSNEVINRCITSLQDFFDINNQQINQPIILREVYILLDKIEGVQTVDNVNITNKVGGNYSQYAYDIKGATQSNIIYPSIDPCIFEVKFPTTDIRGRARTF